jgi:hypothetical protein
MDIFNKSLLNGTLVTEICTDILKLGFELKHPCVTKNIKHLSREQLCVYENLIDIPLRDINIYMVSLLFRVNDKKEPLVYGTGAWTLIKVPQTKEDLKDLVNTLLYIKKSVGPLYFIEQSSRIHKRRLITEDHHILDFYLKYEKYLPVQEPVSFEMIN